MEMTYDGALVMPSSCALMNEDEMTYLEGGSYNLQCSKRFLAKSNCQTTASWLISSGKVTGMTQMAIAKEIFAHVYSYYNYASVTLTFGPVVALYCYNKAKDGIAIMDGGDTGLRASVYNLFWSTYPTNDNYK